MMVTMFVLKIVEVVISTLDTAVVGPTGVDETALLTGLDSTGTDEPGVETATVELANLEKDEVVTGPTGVELEAALEDSGLEETGVVSALEDTGVVKAVETLLEMGVELATGGLVLDGGLQSKPTLWMFMPQLLLPPDGIWKETEVAPPHWELETTEPLLLQEVVCLQVEPSCMP